MDKKIILINIQRGCLHGTSTIDAVPPLGLYCLQALAPEKIIILDVISSTQLLDAFLATNPKVSAFIISNNFSQNREVLYSVASKLRFYDATVPIGVAAIEKTDSEPEFDFYVRGTGRKTVLSILRGENPTGKTFEIPAEITADLPTPVAEVKNKFFYMVAPEKCLERATIEFYRPWLGFFEQSSLSAKPPSLIWLNSLITWLIKNDYASYHFAPTLIESFSSDELHSIMKANKIPYSIGVSVFDDKIAQYLNGFPLRQVWIYNPEVSVANKLINDLKLIKQAGCVACLQLNNDWNLIPQIQANTILKLVSRVIIEDSEQWQAEHIKRTFKSFWSFKFLCRQVLELKNTSELIAFMKIFAKVIAILFASPL